MFWPIFLTSLITIHVVSVVVMVIVATHDSSFAVEPDWYQKSLHYDQTAEQHANSRLNWSVQLEVGQPLTGTNLHNVTCAVLDGSGNPVEKATIDVVALRIYGEQPHVERAVAERRRRLWRDDGFRRSGSVGIPPCHYPRRGDFYPDRETGNLSTHHAPP